MAIGNLAAWSQGTQPNRRCHSNRPARKWSPYAIYLELKRRGVLEAGTNYIVVAWLIAQVAELIGETFQAPYWMLQAMLIALAIGLPIALTLSWVFELTPGGLKRESELAFVEPLKRNKGRGLICALIAVLLLTIGALAVTRPPSVCDAGPHASVAPADILKNL